MHTYQKIERGQGLVVLAISLILLISLGAVISTYWVFELEHYPEIIQTVARIGPEPQLSASNAISSMRIGIRKANIRIGFSVVVAVCAIYLIQIVYYCILIYLGRSWARFYLIIYLLFGSIGAFFWGFLLIATGSPASVGNGLFWWAYTLIALFCTGILLFSSAVRAYAAYMRGE
ncbi:MAG: hypothetical protein R2911_37825 [Caldilineaceae bacterium]